jgi:hypothetical protein
MCDVIFNLSAGFFIVPEETKIEDSIEKVAMV